MPVQIEAKAPDTLKQVRFEPYGPVTPSPADWRDQVFYFLLPDRFSNGRETGEMLSDRKNPERFKAADKRKWMAAGKKFQGGTLEGIRSKFPYLRDLGVTALWLGPVWRQRKDLDMYHGYGIQNFLDVDPRFGNRAALRDLVDEAHSRGIYVILDGSTISTDTPGNTVGCRYERPNRAKLVRVERVSASVRGIEASRDKRQEVEAS